MKNQKVSRFAMAMLLALVGAIYVQPVNAHENELGVNEQGMDHKTMDHHGMKGDMMSHHKMMMDNLKGLTGDAFDKAFLSQMITHHQGAIDMANSAKQQAKHDEIKKMADEIISSQTAEIEKMKNWQTSWSY